MWRRIMAAAVAAVCLLGLQSCSGCSDERRPPPETKKTAPGDFEGSGYESGAPSDAPETPPAEE
ncbi:MAG: hypothetical protein ACYTE6_01230 [Planctomycetota bacterium]|jgi:hypothetical protein